MKIYKNKGRLTLLSPLSHNDEVTLSVDTKFRRMAFMVDGRKVPLPVYSGNAFRGRLRRLIGRDLLEQIGLSEISPELHYLIFCGGSLKQGAKQDYIEVGKRRALREHVPPLSLLGTAAQNWIVAGKLRVGVAMPICKELAPYTGIHSEQSVWSMLDEVYYTRRDDLEDRPERGEDEQRQQMKYTVEVLVPGVVLDHTIHAEGCNELELSCLGRMMRLLEEDGSLGGMSGKGHGKVKFEYEGSWPDPASYLAFLSEKKDAIINYLRKLEEGL
jgi:hypothetical protein